MRRQRHIVRGAVSGFVLGFGIALLLFSYAKIAIGTLAFPLVIACGTVLGLVIGVLGEPAERGAPAGDSPVPR